MKEQQVLELIGHILNAFEKRVAKNEDWNREFIMARSVAVEIYKELVPDHSKSEKVKCQDQK